MKITLIILAAIAMSACGGAVAKNAANSNSNSASSNSSKASPSPSPEGELGKNLPPTTMSVAEFMTYYDKANEGRIVTVENAVLEEISNSALSLRDGSGYGFSCSGSFSDYMDMKSRIDDLRYKNKSPTATVKGVYSPGTNGKPSLTSCVLTDLKR